MEIIPLSMQNINDLIPLNREVQDIHVELFPMIFHHVDEKKLTELFASWIKDNNFKGFIAYKDKEPVGYVCARIIKNEENVFLMPMEFLKVVQICVAKKIRGKYVGKILIDRVVELAKEFNISRIELDYWTANEQAGNAFRSMGFSTYKEKMYLPVK